MLYAQSVFLTIPAGDEHSIREVFHDLRHHIATIDTLTAAARLEPELPDDAAHFLDAARQELHLLRRLCRQIVEPPSRPQQLRLDHVAAGLVGEMRARWSGRVCLSTDACTIVADELELRRMLENLLNNAANAAGPDGTVHLTVRRRPGAVIVEVADSGPGFSQPTDRGTGLGLMIVDQLARKHGWQALVDSSRLGGAVVRLVIPEAAHASDQPGERSLRGRQEQSGRPVIPETVPT